MRYHGARKLELETNEYGNMERENLNWRKPSPGNMERKESALPGNLEQQWEEAEKILSSREMSLGVYRYLGIEYRGESDYGRPISVITMKQKKA